MALRQQPAYMLTAAEIVKATREGALTTTAIVRSCFDRIEALEPTLAAWVTLDQERAYAEAEKLDDEARRGSFRGPLHGVPVGVKDIFFTHALRTTGGSRAFADFVPDYDATTVARLKRAGAVLLGKTATAEFAFTDPPATRNPWNLEHTPGGSSSGSGAAIAARMCPIALGSQTGGSTIRPAAYCGIVGFKPTYGRVSCHGMFPLAESYDHVGIFARTVADAALVLGVISGYDPQDPNSLEVPEESFTGAPEEWPKAPRIGLLGGLFHDNATAETRAGIELLAALLERAGARLEKVVPPPSTGSLVDNFLGKVAVEAASYHQRYFAERRELYGPRIAACVERGLKTSAVEYLRQTRAEREFRRDIRALAARFDGLLAPSTPAPAPKGLASTGDFSFNSPFTMAGLPVIGLPSGLSAAGLPMGIQLVGAPLTEASLLGIARVAEQALDFSSEPTAVPA
jgi:aspartyl-tRNA(Asn)/glutamyl-tRNA(Gln) amidotransferase subunit A